MPSSKKILDRRASRKAAFKSSKPRPSVITESSPSADDDSDYLDLLADLDDSQPASTSTKSAKIGKIVTIGKSSLRRKASAIGKSSGTGKTNDSAPKSYSPNWTEERRKLEELLAKGGKEHGYALRNHRELTEALDKKYGDLEHRHRLVTSISPERQGKLAYSNPFSRMDWVRGCMKGFEVLQPKSPIYAVTLIHKIGDRTTADEGNGYAEFKALAEKVVSEAGASSAGHVEYAVFDKKKVGRAYKAASHAQIIVWGCRLKKLKATLKKYFPVKEDGVLGYKVKRIKRTFHKALSYATKAPTYGYSAWPTEDGTKKRSAGPLPQQCQRQLLQQFQGFAWPDACIATGDGQKIKRTAIYQTGYKPRTNKSPQADNVETPSGVAPPPSGEAATVDPTKLTLETKLNPALQVKAERPLEKLAEEVTTELGKYVDHEKSGDGLFEDAMDKAYGLALSAWGRDQEVEELAYKSKVTFNKRSDLMHLTLKIVARKLTDEQQKEIDKRRVSEGARALRYLYWKGCKAEQFRAKLKTFGGTRKCSQALSQVEPSKKPKAAKSTAKKDWKTIQAHGQGGFTVRVNDIEMSESRGILFAARNKEKNTLYVRHLVTITDALAEELLRKVANDLTSKAKANKAS